MLPFDALNVQLAYYRADEGSYLGKSLDSARYSYDPVVSSAAELGDEGTDEHTNVEEHQGNVRVSYTLKHADGFQTELGVSAELGGLRNQQTGELGSHYAGAVHVEGDYSRWNLQLQGMRYEYAPSNPAGIDNRVIVMGAYDAPYRVAASAWVFNANLAYTVPLEPRPLDSVTLYSDYSHLLKTEDGFADTQELVLGALLAAGPVYTYFDVALGRNHPWLGGNWTEGLGAGESDADWETRLNLNVGFYF